LAIALSALLSAGGAALVPSGQVAAMFGFPALITLTELVRYRVPFGGVPLAGPALGQVDGPLVDVARLGGDLSLVFVTALIGAALAAIVVAARERSRVDGLGAAIAVAVAVVLVVAASATSTGQTRSTMRVAYVQGGGARGLRASENDAAAVYSRHVTASRELSEGLDLVLWPEDVVDIARPITDDPVRDELASIARGLDATVVVGVVEDSDSQRFRNAAVAFDSGGNIADRYDKVHRVPFGEYVPFRSLLERIVDLSDVPRDAVPGKGPGLLLTRAGPLGVLVSFEVFFAERAQAAVRAGGEVILVPTNAASFHGRQVPAQEVAAARLRAIETGRAVIQAAPTGYSAFIDHLGRVRQRSVLGARQVEVATVERRTGTTPYVRRGDRPIIAFTLVLAAAAWVIARRRVTVS